MTNSNDKSGELRGQERRCRWSPEQKLAMVRESLEPGQSVSVVARRNGINSNQLFLWRKLYQDGSLSAVSAGEAVLPASELSGALKQISELRRMLGKKTMEAADGFFVLDECELRETHEDGSIVRCKRQDLTMDEIATYLRIGKVATQLSLAWQYKLSFVLDDKMIIKRLRFESLLEDQAAADGGDEALGQLDASFTLMISGWPCSCTRQRA